MGFVPKTVTLRYLRCAGQFGHGCRVRVFCAGRRAEILLFRPEPGLLKA